MLLLILHSNALESVVTELQQMDKEKDKGNLQSKLALTRDKDSSAKQFIESVKRGLGPHAASKQVTEAAAVACVKLCKASTYINLADSNNVIFKLVQYIINDLKALLFNPSKPFQRSSQSYNMSDIELMIECWVSCFRINPHNMDALKVCLNLQSPGAYHYVIATSLLRIVQQPRLPWWPQTDVIHYKSGELRALFTDTLNKATQGYIPFHAPLKMITSFSLKSNTQRGLLRIDEGPGHKMLLLLIVRLIHADPTLLLDVSFFFKYCFFFFEYFVKKTTTCF